jgi:hypothetical protein
VIDWPAYSPYLNLIKNLWSLMKREFYRLAPDLENAADTQETLDRLIEVAKKHGMLLICRFFAISLAQCPDVLMLLLLQMGNIPKIRWI